MALILNRSFIFLFLALFLSFSLLLLNANATSSEFSTSVLNVTASLLQAQQVFFFEYPEPSYHQHQEETQVISTFSFSSSSSLSLQLHPRDSLLNAQHKDYRSILKSRLDRDSARVNWIISKLQLGLSSHRNKSEHRPEGLSAPVKPGLSEGSGEYFTRIGVGQPAQQFSMVLDTGSDLSWLQCKPCSPCYQQSDPIFDPSASSSYSPITCGAQQCNELEMSGCSNDQCEYEVEYGDGSSTNGVLVSETVSFGNRVVMGCGHVNQGLFVGAAGILGLGRGPLSFLSQIKASSFSYCLVARDSKKSSTLEFNSPRPGGSVTTQLLKNPMQGSFYYVGLAGVSVGGQRVPVPPSTFAIDQSGLGGIIVDSGTAITRLQTQAYNLVRDAFVNLTRDLPRAKGFSVLDTCYDLSSVKSFSAPTVSFQMSDGRSWVLPVTNYLMPVDNQGTFCFAFAPSTAPLSIIGNVQQQATRVTFDLANSIIGFSPDKC
ncbi:protein ASPARTIC PROTEASE IN GUARD CELL 1-like [Gastrolobium bilobum]|uniref:protein ASPARTIC PROTEASE IN GUARD CELL 1-like n=1 Tax=Gastrolobium bilobum TaxID=150636 RepID=UPI002AAFDD96|nr:protein ASPARTIC PROTEASE IN GUARD CELL 1-like [Gastrolobium bilobum]